jgi:acyl carrier protein
VIHAAGALDDGVIEAQSSARIDRVLRPKLDGALHLWQLTRDRPLPLFVMFSSLAGTIGAAGQGNYAAANLVLEGLARRWRGEGRTAIAVAWGRWAQDSGLTRQLSEIDLARLARTGLLPISSALGLSLFDAACASDQAALVATPLDRAALRARTVQDLPAVFHDRVGMPRVRAPAGDAPSEARLRALPEDDRRTALSRLVLAQAAVVLGLPGPDAVERTRSFKDLGFDSLGAVELRNRLRAATGLRLSSTLLFDHPSPSVLVEHLAAALAPAAPAAAPPRAELDGLEAALGALPATELEGLLHDLAPDRARVLERHLDRVLATLRRRAPRLATLGAGAVEADVAHAPLSDLFDLIDGRS